MAANDETTFWTSRRVLVTGAGGFIGSHLVEHLVQNGAVVRAFVRYNSRGDYGLLERIDPSVRTELDVYVGDLTNPEAVTNAVAGTTTVLHLGALIPIPYSYRHPREFVDANVVATLNVLEASRRANLERIVQVSTSEVYGTAQIVPIPETHPLHPQSPYAATKVASDQLALSYARSFDLPIIVARPFNTFGPRQSARAVIPTIIAQALARDHVELGAIDTTRDFLYVDDTVRGLAACARVDDAIGEVFNLGTGIGHTVGEVVLRVGELLGKELTVRSVEQRLRPPRSEVGRLVADTSKARAILGWRPEVDFAVGLRSTVNAVEQSLDSYKATIYNV